MPCKHTYTYIHTCKRESLAKIQKKYKLRYTHYDTYS